jgi:hypothetical protein
MSAFYFLLSVPKGSGGPDDDYENDDITSVLRSLSPSLPPSLSPPSPLSLLLALASSLFSFSLHTRYKTKKVSTDNIAQRVNIMDQLGLAHLHVHTTHTHSAQRPCRQVTGRTHATSHMQIHPRKCTRTQNVFMSNAQTRTIVFAKMSVLIMYACVLRKKNPFSHILTELFQTRKYSYTANRSTLKA